MVAVGLKISMCKSILVSKYREITESLLGLNAGFVNLVILKEKIVISSGSAKPKVNVLLNSELQPCTYS